MNELVKRLFDPRSDLIKALVLPGDLMLDFPVPGNIAADAGAAVRLKQLGEDRNAASAPVLEHFPLSGWESSVETSLQGRPGARVSLIHLAGGFDAEFGTALARVAAANRAVVEIATPGCEPVRQLGDFLCRRGYSAVPCLGEEPVLLLVPAGERAERRRLASLVGPASGDARAARGAALPPAPSGPVESRAARVPAYEPPPASLPAAQMPDGRAAADEIALLQAELSEIRAQLGRVEQRTAGQIDLQSLELSRVKAEMRTRTDMLLSRHEALLNGRIFSTLRRISGYLRLGSPSRAPVQPVVAVQSPPEQAEPPVEIHAVPASAAPDATAAKVAGEAMADALPSPQGVRIAGVPYMSRKKGGVVGAEVTYPGEPLISVIMTTYNTENYVEAAVRSILDQSWRNLELIVVDDCSTDSTRARVESLQKHDSRIRLYCFGENNGTYFCKNFGITKASGSVVTFMDSDDISMPLRLEKQFHALNVNGVAVSTCNHVRKNEDGSTILINGVAERVAYISQMVKRSVIEEIGYFDTVRTSADDEFLRRVRITYGMNAQVNVKDVLYVALLREGSLTRDPANAINFVQDRNASQSFLSPQRRHYAAMCDKWHRHLDERGLRPYMPFPVVRRPYPAFGRLVVGDGRYDGNMITACMATYPPREDKLRTVVAALLPQVDAINIYLNGYEKVPPFLQHSRINAVLGGTDLRDNGKFYFTKDVPRGFCFTVDDDIAYPPEYVQSLIRRIEFYERRAVVGLHGTIYAKPIRSFFRGRTLLHFEEELERDTVVNQLGTGTVAFHTDLLRPELEWFETTGMADVWLALEARKRRIPLIAIARQAHWLLPIGIEETTLFREFRKNDDLQTQVVKRLAPWREELSRDLAVSVVGKKQRLGESYAQMLPMLGIGDKASRA